MGKQAQRYTWGEVVLPTKSVPKVDLPTSEEFAKTFQELYEKMMNIDYLSSTTFSAWCERKDCPICYSQNQTRGTWLHDD